MSYDIVLEQVGSAGYFQLFILFIMGLGKAVPVLHAFSPIFVNFNRKFWCPAWGNDSVASSSCILNQSTLYLNVTDDCTEWEFDTSLIYSTLQSQYGLNCGYEYLCALSTTIYMLGFLLGCSIYGTLSDRFGRMKITSIAGLHSLVVGLLVPFSPSISVYIFGKLLLGIGAAGLLTVQNIGFSEYISAKKKLFWQLNFSNMWTAGVFWMTLLAYIFRSHINLQIACAAFSIIPSLFWFIIPESPRWLVGQHRIEEALKSTQRIAWFNRKSITEEQFMELLEKGELLIGSKKTEREYSLSDFLAKKNMRKMTFINWFNFMVISMVYYVLNFSSGNLGGDIYLNLFLMAIIELAGRAVAMIAGRYVGRAIMLIVGYGLGGIFCLISAYFYKNEEYVIAVIVLAMLGRFFISTVFDIMWLFLIEVYPTVVRNSAVGSASTWARVGGMIAPQLVHVDQFWTPAPFIITGIVSLISGGFCVLLPEPKDHPTLETIPEGEEFAKRRLWSKNHSEDNQLKEINISDS